MVPFKQQIHLGQVGTDVVAVKRALRQHGFGSGTLLTRKAGTAFVANVKRVQKAHHLTADGVYGKSTHAVVGPWFDGYSDKLYSTAKVRPPFGAVPPTARLSAQKVLAYEQSGQYHADNPADMADVHATAQGEAVRNQAGQMVHIDARVFQVLCYLIGKGHRLGTYAICSDHHPDGPHGHSGGYAVDISTVDGVSVANYASRTHVILVNRQLGAAGRLRPRQLISGGCGNQRVAVISAQSIPGADWYYGSATMRDHCNHIHVGY